MAKWVLLLSLQHRYSSLLVRLCISPLNCSAFWIYRYEFIAAAFDVSKRKETTERRSHPMAETCKCCPCVPGKCSRAVSSQQSEWGEKASTSVLYWLFIFPAFKINPRRGIIWIKNRFPLLHLNIFEVFLTKAVQPVCWTAFHTCWTYKSAQAGKWKWWFPSGLGQNWEMGWKERPKRKTWQFPGLTPVM